MAEPNTSTVGVGALAVGLVGATAAPYLVMVAGAVIGAMWPLSSMEFGTVAQKRAGAFFLLRIVSLAVLLSSAGAWYLHEKTNLPVEDGIAVISAIIGAIGNGWGRLIRAGRDGAAKILSGERSDGNP